LQENFLSLVEESDGQALEEKKQEMQQSILVVEDDADLRGFIKSSLGESYHVYEAENGKDGYSIASQTYPDFIISDVMMPEINGFELLQMIRKNRETSHVPFILLTAKTDIESMLEGLEYGADDYISKPFSVKYLKARIANIMSLRHNLLKFYQAGAMSSLKATDKVDEKNGERLITPHDEEFITKARAFIIQNIDNSNFVVEDLATEMSMSRTVFFKKLKGLTGLAPIEFIREIKIRHAADMIVKENYSIKEIAFQIGFADTKYFTQCFKQIFGCTPSEYRKGNEEKA
jgi:YesN/AraC family two-component response regulator